MIRLAARASLAPTDLGSQLNHSGDQFQLGFVLLARHFLQPRVNYLEALEVGIVLWAGGSLGMSGTFQRTFPWQKNDFQEAWVELRFPGFVYWLEVPYGFTRNPKDPLAPRAQNDKEPKFAPAMKRLGKGDRIVAWDAVEYEIGKISGSFQFAGERLARRLTVYQSNPFDAACRLQLYGVRNLRDPVTSVEVEQRAKHRIVEQARGLSYDMSRLSRFDTFKFNRNPVDGGREWGKLKVTVGDKSYRIVIPSSLFKYVHGVSDPYHKSLIRPKGRR